MGMKHWRLYALVNGMWTFEGRGTLTQMREKEKEFKAHGLQTRVVSYDCFKKHPERQHV